MTKHEALLNAADAPAPQQLKRDLVTQARASSTTPMHSEFARLLASVEQLGGELQTLDKLHSQFRAKFGGALPPRQAEQEALQRQTVVFLHERLQRPELSDATALTASARKAIGRAIVALSVHQAAQGDSQMRQIHDLYSSETLAKQDGMQLEELRELLSRMGVDLHELSDSANAAEQARGALDAIASQMRKAQEVDEQRQLKRDQKRETRKAAKAKSDPKAQAKLQAQSQAAVDAQSSLKNIYRQLARQLHPDRAEGDEQRALHHDLMSQVNAAYDKQDLLALLKLQLHAQQIDASAIHSVAEDKLKAWVALLRAQAKELTSDVQRIRMQIMGEFQLPYGCLITTDALELRLKQATHELDEGLHMMRSDLALIKTDAGLKRWAKEQARLIAQDDESLFSTTAPTDDIAHLDAILDEIKQREPTRSTKKKRR